MTQPGITTGNQQLPVVPLWRVLFRHTVPGVDGASVNTYTLAEAIAMMSRWAPKFVATSSLVPAGAFGGPALASHGRRAR